MYLNRKGIQFSSRDVWGQDALAKIIASWLEKFKEDHTKHPFAGCPAYYINRPLPNHPTDKEIEEGQKRFHADIDKMIWAFSADDMPDDRYLSEPTEKLFDGVLDWDKINEHKKKIEEGRKLFAERFDNLWI